MGREIVDVVFVPHHGVAKAERAEGEFERNPPFAMRGVCSGFLRPFDEVRRCAGIGCVNRRMQQPAHQILADDVVIDRGQAIARAEIAFVGGAEMGMGRGLRLAAACHVDKSVMGERKQRGQLGYDGVVVVAGVGDQRFRSRRAHAGNTAVDAGNVLGRRSRDVAERAAGFDIPVLLAHAAEPQFGAALIVWRILREQHRTADRAAAEQRLQPERHAPRVGVFGAELARHRQRHRGLDQVVGDELQQIGVTGGEVGVFPMLDFRISMRGISVRGPGYLGVHPPRQPAHQPADFFRMLRRVQRIDAVGLETLRGFWHAEEVPKTDRHLPVIGVISRGLRDGECERLGSFLHGSFSPLCACEAGEPLVKPS